MGHAAARVSARQALDGFFAAYYRRCPVTATFTGVHDYDGDLPDWSPEGLDGAVAEMQDTRRRLDEAGRVPDEDVADFPDEVDLALADGFLEIQIAEHERLHFYRSNPALWTGEAIFSIVALVTRDFAPLAARASAACDRMALLPAFLGDARRTLIGAPGEWRARASRECGAAETLFGRTLPAWFDCQGLTHARSSEACAVARDAFRAFRTWLEADLPALGADRYSAGPELLSLLLRRGHWVSRGSVELLDEATASLDEAHHALEARLREAGVGSWTEAQAQLATHRAATADDYLPRLAWIWSRAREAALAADLVTWPDRPIRYVPIPEHTRDAAPLLYYLFYRSPAPFDRLPVHEYVVTPVDDVPADEVDRRLAAANDSVMTLNHVVHHGGLGHHVQNARAYEGRSRIGQVAAVDAASRISMFCGGSLAEGWACYACDLMEEVGFLSPLERASQQHTRVRLLARAVADLSLHSGTATFDDTIAIFERRGLMPAATARAEAVKASMFPGTAAMYWIGTNGIHRLRAAVEAAEGAAFSRRRFHDAVLGYGAIPVELIARLMTGTRVPATDEHG
jgi:hypothetical protein